jgi:hypothetical protein
LRYAGSELGFGSEVPTYALDCSQTVVYGQSEGVGAKTEVPHLSESVGIRMLRLMQQRLQNTALLSTPQQESVWRNVKYAGLQEGAKFG